MAASYPRLAHALARHTAAIVAAAVLASALAGGAVLADADPVAGRRGVVDQAVSVDAASSEVDYRTNMVLFRDVVVTQGATRVSADQARATGLNFDDARWVFSGNVRIAVEGGGLTSNEATVSFVANRMTRATIVGTPAQFEQQRAGSTEMARGRARSIEYKVDAGVVTLSNDAWLSDGRNEINGQLLVYSIKDQRVRAGAQTGQPDRVRITIRPNDSKPAATPEPPPAPRP
jgi:lipopolysaccharide export system protein LptA